MLHLVGSPTFHVAAHLFSYHLIPPRIVQSDLYSSIKMMSGRGLRSVKIIIEGLSKIFEDKVLKQTILQKINDKICNRICISCLNHLL